MEQELSGSGIGRILVAYDGSEGALKACEMAAVLAKGLGSDVTLLYVIPSLSIFTAPLEDSYYSIHQEEAAKLVRKADRLFKKNNVKVRKEILRARASIVETIVEYAADEGSGVIVMGARGLGGFRKMLLGSVSSGVLAHALCPVFVVR